MAFKFEGNAKTATGTPFERVLIRDWGTRLHVSEILIDARGDWSYDVPDGSYDLTYLSVGCTPVCRGPYTVSGPWSPLDLGSDIKLWWESDSEFLFQDNPPTRVADEEDKDVVSWVERFAGEHILSQASPIITPKRRLDLGGESAVLFENHKVLEIPDHADFNIFAGDFRFGFYMYLTGYSESYEGIYNASPVSKDIPNEREWSTRIYGTSSSWDGVQLIWFDTSGTNSEAIDVSFTFQLETWYRVEFFKIGSSVTVSIDGVQIGDPATISLLVNTQSLSPLTVGGVYRSDYEFYFPGALKDIWFATP